MSRDVALIIVGVTLVMLVPLGEKFLNLSTAVAVVAFLAFSMIAIAGMESIIRAWRAGSRQ